MSIAQQLKAARIHAGLWQRELATMIDTDRAVVARIERGETDPHWSTVERLATALNTTFTIGGGK